MLSKEKKCHQAERDRKGKKTPTPLLIVNYSVEETLFTCWAELIQVEYLRDHLARNQGPCFGCTSALGFCSEIFLCFSAKQHSCCFKQHFHKPLLICAPEKCIFLPKRHLICENQGPELLLSLCLDLGTTGPQQLNAVHLYPSTCTGALCAHNPHGCYSGMSCLCLWTLAAR